MYDEKAGRRLTRLATRWHSAADDDERDSIFARILDIVMTMPVVGAAKARTAASVGGHFPAYADEEDAAIQRAAFRSLCRWDPDAGVPFGPYLTRGLRVGIHDFWRTFIRTTLCCYVPAKEWLAWQQAIVIQTYEGGDPPDELLDAVCRHAAFWQPIDDRTITHSLHGIYQDEWDDVWEDDDNGSL